MGRGGNSSSLSIEDGGCRQGDMSQAAEGEGDSGKIELAMSVQREGMVVIS